MSNDTPQSLDPIGGITARFLVVFGVALGLVIAVVMSLSSAAQLSYPAVEVLAIALAAGAGALFIRASSPFHAPLRRSTHVVVTTLLLASVGANGLAQWGTDSTMRDDWGPLTMGLMVLMMGSYRPAHEMVVFSTISSLLIGLFAAVRSEQFAAQVPPPVFAILAATPVLAAGLGSAAFSRSLVRTLQGWRASTAQVPLRSGTTGSTHGSLVDDEITPFLAAFVTDGNVTADDGIRARAYSQQLRTLIIGDAERGWADELVPQLSDPELLAGAMNTDQRGCLRALVAHLGNSDAFAEETTTLRFSREGWMNVCRVDVECRGILNPRVQLAPYIAVARNVFARVHWNLDGASLTLAVGFEPPAR